MSEILSIGELLDLGGNASSMSAYVPFSSLNYSGSTITGISGSAIGGQGGTDSATVSAIASSYAESAMSGKLDNSASGTWYPLEGNPSGFITGVDLSPYAYASSVHEYSGVNPVVVDNSANTISLDSTPIHFDSSMRSYVSGGSGFVGVNSAGLQPAANYAYQSSLDMYAFKSALSAFAYESSLSSKLDSSAAYAPTFEYDADDRISSIDGSAVAGGCNYVSPSGTLAVDNVNGTIDSWNSSLRVDELITAASSMPGTANYTSDGFGHLTRLWTGNAISGDAVLFSASSDNWSTPFGISGYGVKDGGVEVLVASTPVGFTYTGSASGTIDREFSGFIMRISGTYAEPFYTQISAIVNVERPGETASATSVYENVLKDSMWQSLTAWATSQGWTP